MSSDPAPKGTLFLSRAGADEAVAAQIGRLLEEDGYSVVLQQWDFKNRSFVDAMHDALLSDARVVALLSPDYLASDYCAAEWQGAIATDPLNRKGRLIVLRIAECTPAGLLAGFAYWDLVPVRNDPATLADVVRRAVSPSDRSSHGATLGAYRQAAQPLPTGTVTFLFAEIEGGAERWERDRLGMEAAVRRTSAILNGAIDAHRGRLFRSSGETCASAFEQPGDALLAAVDAQRALTEEDFASQDVCVRMALHAGPTTLNAADYIGPAVNRAARLLAVGHGGQIVASAIMGDLLAGMLPDAVSLLDLGEHRLKDLTYSEAIYQVCAPGLKPAFPPLQDMGALPNNLPLQMTRLIGRDGVVEDVRSLIERNRLVTLVGTGGLGKTRVALQVAADLLDGSGDGVWFVDLAPLVDPGLVASAVASTLSVRESSGESIQQTLIRYLKPRNILLVLDNCEHVVASAQALAAEITRTCPKVRLLATSRERLQVHGEIPFHMPALSVPESGMKVSASEALRFGATAWFVERATLANPRFALSDANAPIVADICRRLDGIPFAIEFAAARVNVLTVSELARRIDQMLPLISGGNRDAPRHRQSLRALIDWSHELLTPAEQALFRRLAAFSGGCLLEAAESVCAGDPVFDFEVLDLVSSLVDKSLVVAEVHNEGTTRYRFLETTRAYALEKLAASGEGDSLARGRAAWVVSFAERVLEQSWTSPSADWLAHVIPELENIRAALKWAMDTHDLEVGGRIAGGLTALWQARAIAEGRRVVEKLLEDWPQGYAPKVEAQLWVGLAAMTVAKRRLDAAEAALRLYESLGDRLGLAQSLRYRGEALRQMQQLNEAAQSTERALHLFHELRLESSSHYPALLQTNASILVDFGRNDEARELYAEALSRFQTIGDEPAMTNVRVQLAELECAAGNLERAVTLNDEATLTAERLGDLVIQTVMLCNGAAYRLLSGDLAGAGAAARDAMELAMVVDINLYATMALQHLGALAAMTGDARRGAVLLSYTDHWFSGEGFERELTEQQTYDRGMEAVHRSVSPDELGELLARGAALSQEAAVAEARKVVVRAEAAVNS